MGKKFGNRNMTQLIPPNQQLQMLDHPVNHVCHMVNPTTKKVNFIAMDSFNTHYFDMNPSNFHYTQFVSYAGNNEI
jgi:hypothetical protein